jgi:predicted nucleic acid-binding protein
MKLAYVDTSCLVAIAFAEAGATKVASRLRRMDRLFASNLLEAELRSALAREGLSVDPAGLLSGITWVHPNRSLSGEFERVTVEGYVKGADLWHLACALFLTPEPKDLAFLTLDRRQEEIARKLGFTA